MVVDPQLDYEDIVFRWLGTAGFSIRTRSTHLLVDPFITRNPNALYRQQFKPEDFSDASHIFISHGHFDHAIDVPQIARTSNASIFCSHKTAKYLISEGIPIERINPLSGREKLSIEKGVGVDVARCRHIVFDPLLVYRTLIRLEKAGKTRESLAHLKMGAGPVLIYTFIISGLKFTHMGSLGLKPEKIPAAGLLPPDILFLPVQGHTRIKTLAAQFAAALKPEAVIPHHYDNSFPPISQEIYLEPFRRMLKELLPECAYYEPKINEPFTLRDIFMQK